MKFSRWVGASDPDVSNHVESAEAMSAPRARDQADPPSPPDRPPARQGGGSSPHLYAVCAVALLVLSGALALPATAEAQTATTLVSDIGQGTHITDEQSETFTATLSNASSAKLPDPPPTARGTIRRGSLPVLEFTKSPVAIEDSEIAKVFLKLDRAASVPIKVHWETSDLSPASAVAGVDYWPGSGTVTFAPGDVEEQFRVMLRNDDRAEDTEKFLVTIRPANPALVAVPAYEKEYTIIDTDELKLTVDVETVVREAARVAHVRVYAEEVPLDFDFNFQYETQPGTVVPEGLQGNNAYTAYVAEAAGLTYAAATEGRDYRHTTGTLTFGPGRLRHTITVPIINDGAQEEPELFQIWMQRVKETDRRIRGPGRAARVVIDRSDYPLVSLWDAEGVEGEDMVFTVALSKATGADVTVDWTVDFWRGSTADAADFETMSGTATVAAGSREATFTVATADDAADEEDETFLVRLSNFSWNSQIGDPTATGVITDNDVSPFEGGEGASRYTNTRVMQTTVRKPDGAAWTGGDTVRVAVRFAGPVQYTPPDEPQNRDEVFVNETGGTPTIRLLLGDHERRTLARTASYMSGSGTNTLVFEYEVTAGDGRVGAVEVVPDSLASNGATIRNEDGYDAELNHVGVLWYSPLALRVGDAAAAREGGTLRFTMELARASEAPVTVDYETADGTATVGEDYTAKRGTVTFAPGRTRKTVRVRVLRDGEAEDAETVVLRLSNARSGGSQVPVEVTVGQAEGMIEDVAPEAPSGGLTARFARAPAAHDGKAFRLRIAFSETIRMSGRRLRGDVVAVAGGRATKAGAVNGRKDRWDLTVKPASLADVTVTLAAGAACDSPAAVCTADGKALSHTLSTTVRGPVTVSVADARVREAAGATLDFAVRLSRAAAGAVSVTYATADGSARAGSDYTARKGQLKFAPGETEKTVSVPVLDDAHDEGAETMRLRLSAASGAVIADGEATGTIENTDHMPAAWLARFGRTVTDQVLEAVEGRLKAPRAAGLRATFAGQALPFWEEGGGKAAANDDASDRAAMAALREWMAPGGANGERRGDGADGRSRWRPLSGRELVTGTSFALTGGSAESGGHAAFWGRGAHSRFDGREGELTLDGEVTTGLMGADWAAERWRVGLAVGHARGAGGYREGGSCAGKDRGAGGCAGEVEARLTGVWPYAGLELTERLSAWAAAGYGAGELRLTPGGGSPFTADLTMAMGAAGLRGEVLRPGAEGGLALAVKGDTRFTRTESEATKDANDGKLEAAAADVWLVRGGVEGSRRFALEGDAAGMVLTPSFEIGARLDGGDAETGLGVDLGGGLAFAAPRQGLTLDLKARGLVAHEASGFREWGASASLAWDPRPETDRGLALTLRQSWGGSPAGGMDALLGRETLAGVAASPGSGAGASDNGGDTPSAGRLEAELGYGIAMFGGGFTGTPYLGFGLTDGGRDYRLGWRLNPAGRGDRGLALDLEATRREGADADAEHGVMLRATIRW